MSAIEKLIFATMQHDPLTGFWQEKMAREAAEELTALQAALEEAKAVISGALQVAAIAEAYADMEGRELGSVYLLRRDGGDWLAKYEKKGESAAQSP